MTGIVLAGGRSARMGCDKAFLPWQGSDFLHVILENLASVCHERIVVTGTPPPDNLPAVKFVPDILPNGGPLSGIHAGLVRSSSPFAFVTACDMPFIQPAAAAWILSRMQDWDIVVPGCGEFAEPFFACYSKRCIPAIEDLLHKDIRKVKALFRQVRCLFIPFDDFRAFDPELLLFRSVNSPEEYQAALRLIEDRL